MLISTSERRLLQIQGVSGAVFFVFLIVHLGNVLMAPFGESVFNAYQQAARTVYQHPAIELPFVLSPIVVHAVAGVWLFVIRRANQNMSWRARLHRYSAAFLLLVVGGHVVAVRGPSAFFDVWPEFEGISFSLWFFPAWFFPYYFLLAMAGFYHGANGLRMVLARGGWIPHAGIPAAWLAVAGVSFAICLAALGGMFFSVPNPADSEFGRLYESVIGIQMDKPWR